jgi:Calpain family cysteine protease
MEHQLPTQATQKEQPVKATSSSPLQSSSAVTLHPVLRLQRAVGNQAVQRMINSGRLQTKLKVNQPGDAYEQEADQVAKQVMRMANPETSVSDGEPVASASKGPSGVIRRTPVRDERKLTEAEGLFKRVKESLQKNTTLTGAKIEITPSLMVLIEPRMAKLPIPQDDRSAAIYKEFRGEAFVQGGNRSKDVDKFLLDSEDVDINDVRQGHLGDCYLFAAMAAIAQANPQAIRDLIHKNDDGTYDVKLYIYNSKWQPHRRTPVIMKKIQPLFPSWKKSGKSAYGHPSEGEDVGDPIELWPMLIEKAYAYYRSGYDMIEIQAGRDVEDIIPMLVKGVTKWDTKTYDLEDKDQTEETIVTTISQALEKNMPVTAGSKDEDTMPTEEQKKTVPCEYDLDRDAHPGVHPHHDYVPTRISKQSIDLYNPWGYAHLRNLPISLFKACFDVYTITKLPLPKSSVKKE